MSVVSRQQAAEQSAAILRLEGLQSSPEVDDLLAAWAAGSVSDEELVEAERSIVAGRAVPTASRAA